MDIKNHAIKESVRQEQKANISQIFLWFTDISLILKHFAQVVQLCYQNKSSSSIAYKITLFRPVLDHEECQIYLIRIHRQKLAAAGHNEVVYLLGSRLVDNAT